jgi:hypothetical protein
MHKNLRICLLLTILVCVACNNIQKKNETVISSQCNSCCLKKLASFADTLNVSSLHPFYYYFDEKHFSLGNCELKKLRGDASLKNSLVLIWLKIDNAYLKRKWAYSYVQDIGGNSKAAYQIVREFYFLTTKEDPPVIEFMTPMWVYPVIKSDNSLLNNRHIKNLYEENTLLGLRNKRSKKHHK